MFVLEVCCICFDLVIVMGEDFIDFCNVSKIFFGFLRLFFWNGRVERLGFDEVFLG